jgi:DnaK suppressor protein
MSAEPAALTPEFVARQRTRLEALRHQVLGGELASNAGRRDFEEQHGDEPTEFEDRAQDTAQEDERQAQRDVDQARVERIERALRKIEEGTYGYSDLSGNPIPRARLEATPEAILTLEEERDAERRR